MLDEQEIEEYCTDIASIYANFEIKIIVDIAKRIQKFGIFDEQIQNKLNELEKKGYSKQKIMYMVRSYLNGDNEYKKMASENNKGYQKFYKTAVISLLLANRKQIKKTLFDSYNQTFKNDVKTWKSLGLKEPSEKNIKNIPLKLFKNTFKYITNSIKAIGFKQQGFPVSIKNSFNYNLEKTIMNVVSGKKTFEQSLLDTIKSLSKSGVKSIDYKNNRAVEVVSNVRQTMMTVINRMCGDISSQNMIDTKVKYVEVDVSSCPRPSHALWEGQVYTYDEFVDICGYGDETDPDNIYSYNCYHHHYPLKFKDQAIKYKKPSKNVKYGGGLIDRYEASQVLRQTERDIRDLNRNKAIIKKLELDTKLIDAQLKQQKSFYNDFCKQTNIPKKTNRFEIYE